MSSSLFLECLREIEVAHPPERLIFPERVARRESVNTNYPYEKPLADNRFDRAATISIDRPRPRAVFVIPREYRTEESNVTR